MDESLESDDDAWKMEDYIWAKSNSIEGGLGECGSLWMLWCKLFQKDESSKPLTPSTDACDQYVSTNSEWVNPANL